MPITGEVDKRNNGKTQLQTEHHLTQDQQIAQAIFAKTTTTRGDLVEQARRLLAAPATGRQGDR